MNGQDILKEAVNTILMKPTKFSTGSTGFRGQGKVADTESADKYQVQIIATKIGSKPKV